MNDEVEEDYLDKFEEAAEAIQKRMSAENTYLRHSFLELRGEIALMNKTVAAQRKVMAEIDKALGITLNRARDVAGARDALRTIAQKKKKEEK